MPKPKSTQQLLEDTVTVLALRLPLRRPVRIEIVRHSERLHGCTSLDNKGYLIQLTQGNRHVMLDTLIHEWAHARAWRSRRPHGDKWGKEYAKAYRLVIGDDKL